MSPRGGIKQESGVSGGTRDEVDAAEEWAPPPLDSQRAPRELLPTSSWRLAIREICSRHGIDWSTAAPFASGSDVVWSVGSFVVKLTAPVWAWQISAEARNLDRCRDALSVRTPAPLETGELRGWPYIVMGRAPGVALGSIWPGLGHAERLRLAGALGRLTRELHSLDVTAEPDDWSDFRNECIASIGQRSEQGVPDELVAEVEPFLQSIGELASEPHVFLHTELLDQHVLVEEDRGRYSLSGLIDFADGRVGPAEYDFPAPVEFIFRGEPGLSREFLLAYGYAPDELTSGCSERLLAWGLSHRYGSLKRMLRCVEPARPTTLSALAEMLYGLDEGSSTAR